MPAVKSGTRREISEAVSGSQRGLGSPWPEQARLLLPGPAPCSFLQPPVLHLSLRVSLSDLPMFFDPLGHLSVLPPSLYEDEKFLQVWGAPLQIVMVPGGGLRCASLPPLGSSSTLSSPAPDCTVYSKKAAAAGIGAPSRDDLDLTGLDSQTENCVAVLWGLAQEGCGRQVRTWAAWSGCRLTPGQGLLPAVRVVIVGPCLARGRGCQSKASASFVHCPRTAAAAQSARTQWAGCSSCPWAVQVL